MTNILKNIKSFNFPKQGIKTLALAVSLSTLGLYGCSNGAESKGPSHAGEMQATAVKGPLNAAEMRFFVLDLSKEDLKGREIAAKNTNSAGEVTGVSFGEDLLTQGPFLIEVTGGTERSGQAPVISTLRSIVTVAQAESRKVIYATPLSTIMVELAKNMADLTDPATAKGNFNAQFIKSKTGEAETAASIVTRALGFNLAGNAPILLTAPVLTEGVVDITEEEVADGVVVSESQSGARRANDMRMAHEAFALIVNDLAVAANAGSDTIISAIGKDLADGNLNGLAGEEAILDYGSLSTLQVFNTISQPPEAVFARNIPGFNTPISQMADFLVQEAAELKPEISVEAAIPTFESTPRANTAYDDTKAEGEGCPIIDQDCDGFPSYIDQDDSDPAITNDSDGDGVDDLVDVFPNDINEWEDVDGDGKGDNLADACTDFAGGFDDSDSDSFCACTIQEGAPNFDEFCLGRDVFPNDPTEWADANNNGIGDNSEGIPTASLAGTTAAYNYIVGGMDITLDGSASTTPPGTTFKWEIVEQPEGIVAIVIADDTAQVTTFNVELKGLNELGSSTVLSNGVIGDFKVRLRVTNSLGVEGTFDEKTITVSKSWFAGGAGLLFGSAIVSYALIALPFRRRRAAKLAAKKKL